jgi:hypothetical protein
MDFSFFRKPVATALFFASVPQTELNAVMERMHLPPARPGAEAPVEDEP